MFGLDRKTVRKMLSFSVPPGYRRGKPPRRPKLGPFTGIIDRILEDDRTSHHKQRHTAKRIFDRLRDEYGFTGGYTIVKDYVRERRLRSREMFVPLVHSPGHAQADFGEAMAVIGGVARKVHFLAFDLPHSDACFVKAYPAETTEAFCDGHNAAVAFFGGVPRSILYDNTKLAVARILGDGKRQRTRVFTELQSHYLFEDRFGRPGKGNDKGKVEGLVGFIRRNFLVPVPAGRELRGPQRCSRGTVPPAPGGAAAGSQGDHRRAPRTGPGSLLASTPGTIRCLRQAPWTGELAVAGALPGQRLLGARGLWPPRGADPVLRRRGRYLLRRGGDCPAPPVLRQRGPDLRPAALSTLDRAEDRRPRPGRAVGGLEPARGLHLTLRRLLEARMGKAGKREYVQVLRLLETFRLEEVEGAVGDALRLGAIGFDAVKHLVLCRIERRPPRLNLDVYPYLPRARVATTSAKSYMSLLSGLGA